MQQQKINVTQQRMGEVLFALAFETARRSLADKALLEGLGVERKSSDHVFRELMVILMFTITLASKRLLKDEATETAVASFMHKIYLEHLAEHLNKGASPVSDDLAAQRSHLMTRHEEYGKALQEERGPNRLWPLTHHALNNLREEQTEDFWAMWRLTVIIGESMKAVASMVGAFEVTDNWN